MPLTISYEYDPCDYLKAQEFQQKRDNPAFKKSKQDDLDNMKTGIFGYKGRVHYQCAQPVNTWIDELKDLPRKEFFATIAQRMDREIHRGYQLFPCNYIAARPARTERPVCRPLYRGRRERFEKYLQGQLAKIKLPEKDEPFLRERMLTMYANPVIKLCCPKFVYCYFFFYFFFFLSLSLLLSCTTDAYDKGEGEYSQLRADFVEAHVGSDKRVDYVLTDDGDSLRTNPPFTVSWITKRQTPLCRALFYYNLQDG